MRLIKVGHDMNCDLVLKSNKVSGLHAEIIVLNNGDILLEDKGSRNGTFLQGRQVNPGSTVSVRRGDRIMFGDTELDWSHIPQPENISGYRALYGIGSNFRNEIKVSGNSVSRFHATLKIARDGKIYIEDHSRNGTTVDGITIPSGKNVRIKRSSTVCVAGQQIDIKPYIPQPVLPKVVAMISSVAAIIALILFLPLDFVKSCVSDVDRNPSKAVACVVASFHYTVTFDDDPFLDLVDGWPKKLHIGKSKDGKWYIGTTGSNVPSLSYTGTAFFVDNFGRMLTNRHVACPWEYRNNETNDAINQLVAEWKASKLPSQQIVDMNSLIQWSRSSTEYGQVLLHAVLSDDISLRQLNAYVQRFSTSRIKISGENDRVSVGFAYRKYTDYSEFEHCTVIGDTQSDDIDIAMLQLNSGETPEKIKPHVIDIRKAYLNPHDMKVGRATYTFIGFPGGLDLNLEKLNGLSPLIYSGSMSRRPEKYKMEIQSMTWPGASGSPIIDNNNRLAGIVSETMDFTTMTYGVLAKYAVDFYDRIIGEDPAEY